MNRIVDMVSMIMVGVMFVGIGIWIWTMLRFPIARHDYSCTAFGVALGALFIYSGCFLFKTVPKRWR